MAEVWDQVQPHAAARQKCLEEVGELRTKCKQDHAKDTVIECPECYGRVIDRIRQRYLKSPSPEWFSGRRLFLSDLEATLSAAKTLDLDPRNLESLIQDEKRKWYLENVRNSVISVIAEDSLGSDTLLEMLGSRDFPLEDLASEIRHALGQDTAELDVTRALLDRLTSPAAIAETDAAAQAERQAVLKQALFAVGSSSSSSSSTSPDDQVSKSELKYYAMLGLGIPAHTVAEQIVDDRQASRGARDAEERHKQRINDLQRARAAHELQKTRKTAGLGLGAAAEKPVVPERFYRPSACATCGRDVGLKDGISCALCQVLEDLKVEGFKAEETPDTSEVRAEQWCSQKCYAQILDEHVASLPSHHCASGDACVRVLDGDVDMDVDSDVVYLCNECVHDLKRGSVFCSPRCAGANFQSHREEVHLPGRRRLGVAVDTAEDLVYSEEDASRYFPKNIRHHVTSLDDALRDLERRTGVSVGEVE